MTSSIKNDSPLPLWLCRSAPLRATSFLYSLFIKYRNNHYDNYSSASYKPERKVISIGAIRAGGTGKTPTALMIGKYILTQQYGIAFLSRGYKRKFKNDLIVHPNELTDWEKVGDEPAMLHSLLPQSWLGISANRAKTASNLCKLTPEKTVFLLDDGFQHRQLRRDLDIVCINETTLNDKLIPCGYLREPVHSLSRADAFFLIGSRDATRKLEKIKNDLRFRFPDTISLILIQEVDCWVNASTGETASKPPLSSPVAFCGIARPERFFDMLRSQGIAPCKEIANPDHYMYTEKYFNSIHELYSHGMVTTEKDAIRLHKFKVDIGPEFWYLKIKLNFFNQESQDCFNRLIISTISNT